ncbi:type I secretion system permease/ATPase [Aromatoleum anaerobium]|uniref:Type I secretion system permease/ATPase n=1 Tax=Aromatoleum anaerobium TaxID=182180 RepID=A0ABX1PQ67_9RHOO|nr:type I secretion system permease/ATPase [Aromatoleum anaerobium]MCK0505531.1 type I secretion system permease/ATPase [Aromatoleum anaerobium]
MPSTDTPRRLPTLLAPLHSALWYAAGFSIFVNLMLLGPTLYMLQVFDRVLSSRSEATLAMLSVGVAIALVAMSAVEVARSRVLVEVGRRIDECLGETVLRHIVRVASAPAPASPSGGLRDVGTLRGFLSGANVIALFDAPWMGVYVIVIFLFHPALGAVALGGALLLMAIAWSTERANRTALEQLAESTRRGAQFVDQGLRNADVLNGMGMTVAFAARWNGLNRRTLDLMQTSSTRAGSLLAASKFLRQAIQVTMMGVGAWLVLDNHVTPGIMIAGTILFGRAMAPVEALIGNWSGLVAARGAYRRLTQLLPAAQDSGERTPLPTPTGKLQLERIALAGRSPDFPLLRHVDFTLPASKSLGILGPSGAGKSSLAKVMVGVWAPSAGKVRIDGAEIAQWDVQQLGPHLGYLPQDVELFPGTVAENIARFDTQAGPEVVEAACRAHAYDMILKLPDGFNTLLGEGGIRLSAGQAQRVGLARALFRRPCIVVLDEPNANLDADGEQALVLTLAELRQERTTVVVITHKASLVAPLDYLLVLREGRMELLGPRDEVLARLSGSAQPAAAAELMQGAA